MKGLNMSSNLSLDTSVSTSVTLYRVKSKRTGIAISEDAVTEISARELVRAWNDSQPNDPATLVPIVWCEAPEDDADEINDVGEPVEISEEQQASGEAVCDLLFELSDGAIEANGPDHELKVWDDELDAFREQRGDEPYFVQVRFCYPEPYLFVDSRKPVLPGVAKKLRKVAATWLELANKLEAEGGAA